MLTLYPYTFPPLHTLPSFVPADHEIAHQWSGNPHSWDSIYQHQRKPQRLLVKLLTNKSNTTERKTFFSFFLVVTGIKGLSLSFFPCSFHDIVLSTLWCIYSRVESGCKCCPFTCCYVKFRGDRDRVRHVLDAVVAVVFIKVPVLNSGDEDSGKLNVSCGKHLVIQNTYGKSETDRINEGNYGR